MLKSHDHRGLWNGLVCKGSCGQAWQAELSPWNPHSGKREPIPARSLWHVAPARPISHRRNSKEMEKCLRICLWTGLHNPVLYRKASNFPYSDRNFASKKNIISYSQIPLLFVIWQGGVTLSQSSGQVERILNPVINYVFNIEIPVVWNPHVSNDTFLNSNPDCLHGCFKLTVITSLLKWLKKELIDKSLAFICYYFSLCVCL